MINKCKLFNLNRVPEDFMAGEKVEEEVLLCLDRITCMKLKELVSKEDMDSIYNQFIKKEMVPTVEHFYICHVTDIIRGGLQVRNGGTRSYTH